MAPRGRRCSEPNQFVNPIRSPNFDLFYVMPAMPESISYGTLLFCVCIYIYIYATYMHNGRSRRAESYLQLSWRELERPKMDGKNRFRPRVRRKLNSSGQTRITKHCCSPPTVRRIRIANSSARIPRIFDTGDL